VLGEGLVSCAAMAGQHCRLLAPSPALRQGEYGGSGRRDTRQKPRPSAADAPSRIGYAAPVGFSVRREILVGKNEIEHMAEQMLAKMPNARQQVAVALERELHERPLKTAGRASLSEVIHAPKSLG
jgi:hypothetical protein